MSSSRKSVDAKNKGGNNINENNIDNKDYIYFVSPLRNTGSGSYSQHGNILAIYLLLSKTMKIRY